VSAMAGRPVTVVEPFRSVFYAPQFVTLHLGLFAAEGLDVRVVTAGGGLTTTQALLDGACEISLGGIMRSLDVAERTGARLPHFAEVNSRNGFFLLGRAPRPDFAWRDLVGRTVLSFAEAPTPWQCLLTVLRRHGVDPARVRIERDRPVAEAVAAFRAGHGDFLEQGQTVVEELLAEGAAHLVASMGEATGPLPFSSYLTTPARLADDSGLIVAFTRALARGQQWIAGHGAAEIARVVGPAFPAVRPDLLEAAVGRYLRQHTWARDPLIRRPGYEYLQQILLDGGFIARRHRYEDLVDTALAAQALATLGP
jgi:NitT/TauT family transport system substrate-binding protein